VELIHLRTEDYDYQLPARQIATQPAPRRDQSRLLILSRDTAQRNHALFGDIGHFLRPRSLIVINDTRVIPARLMASKPTGGRVEVFLVERIPEAPSANHATSWHEDWRALARNLGHTAPGARLPISADLQAEILARGSRGDVTLRFHGPGRADLLSRIEGIGAIPLPPYIEAARKEQGAAVVGPEDRVRYQTVYAREPGAVAAPTAGLHFTEELLAKLQGQGHELARVTLHVGPGTFRPVTSEDPTQHQLDPERYQVSEDTAESLRRAQAEGRPIVAVGTTVVRTLETLAQKGPIAAGSGATNLYILPGAPFRLVTDLVTNFHLPRSSLLMLVAAFAGHEPVMATYREAVEQGYRFYSYGDAMFIRPGELPR
jgi:S-adenosylmethionine:tRNA ribosyltransferase-isomerase